MLRISVTRPIPIANIASNIAIKVIAYYALLNWARVPFSPKLQFRAGGEVGDFFMLFSVCCVSPTGVKKPPHGAIGQLAAFKSQWNYATPLALNQAIAR